MAKIIDGARYDLVVIGGGAAGLVSSGFARALGLSVALVSDGHPGGECLWTGCVPSKALIHKGQIASTLRKYDSEAEEKQNLFIKAFEHMNSARSKISHHDSIETVEKSGVEVLIGRARFLNSNCIEVDGARIFGNRFIVATGGYQHIPEALREAGVLTHESILELTEKPESICIVGAGPVGVEYAQTLKRLGVEKIYLIEYSDRLLPREEPEISILVNEILQEEGVETFTGFSAAAATRIDDRKRVVLESKDRRIELDVDQILLATGKTAATKDLGLDAAGVRLNERGFIEVDRHQRSSALNIFAAGDVCGLYQFTHYADHTAQIAALGAAFPLFIPFFNREERVVPWCTFFDPEIASVGMRKEEALARHGQSNVFELRYSLADFDRAIVDDQARGMLIALVDKKGQILGATIAGARAGEVIHEFALAMQNKIAITALARTIHVYPTMSAAVRNLSAQYYKVVAGNSASLKLAKMISALMR